MEISGAAFVGRMLEGLRVLEIGRNVSGPFCAYLMAANGAEVIKVEPPGEGDPARAVGPFPDDIPHPEKSALFLYLNAGKKSLTLNMNTRAGSRLFRELVAGVDIVVENLSARMADSLDLNYDALAAVNPKLVLTSISTFGRSGPYSHYEGEELVAQAMGGWMYILGEADQPPLKYGGYAASYMGGYAGFAGSLTAYHYACLSGQGQHVDVSIMECLAGGHAQALVTYTYTGRIQKRGRSGQIFPCRDGFVWATFQQHMWPRFARLIERPDLINDPRFKTAEDRQQNFYELEQYVLPWMMERTREDIFRQAQELRLPFGYVADIEQARRSRQSLHRNFFVDVEHPVAGAQVHPGLPVRIQGASWHVGPAPTLGQHNEEVICGKLGYSHSDLVQMRRVAII